MSEFDLLKKENVKLKLKLKNITDNSLKKTDDYPQDDVFFDENIRLYNIRYLNIRLDEEMKRAKRYNQFLSLILLNVDTFAEDNVMENDVTDIPDERKNVLMKKLGEFIKANLRDTDILSLYNQDVLALILPETSVEGAVCLSERLKDQILFAFSSGEINNAEKGNSVSIGITSYPTDARVIDELIKNAAHMLNCSKGSENNTIYCSIMN